MRLIFVKKIVFFAATFIAIFPVNPLAQDKINHMNTSKNGSTLSDIYTLGRVIGTRTTTDLFIPRFDNNQVSLQNLFHFSAGTDNKSAFGFSTSLQALGVRDALQLLLMIPEFDLKLAPNRSNRISATILPFNLLFAVSEGMAITGFDFPFTTMNSYSWDFLSKNGQIDVPEDQYENSFFFGPQLNPGQVRLGADFTHPILFESTVFPISLAGALEFGIGLPGNFSNSSSFSFNRIAEETYTNQSSIIDSYDTTDVTTTFEWRTPFSTMQAGYRYLDRFFQQHTIQLSGTYLTGPYTTSFSEVNGNWDGTFSPLLHARQFMIQLHCRYLLKDSYLPTNQAVLLNNDIRYGITNFFTIGYAGSLNIQKNGNPLFIAVPGIHLSNIPRRTRGPTEVTPFEYQFGYWPRHGEYQLAISYKLPLNDPPTYYLDYPYNFIPSNYSSIHSDMFGMNTSFNRTFGIALTDPRIEPLNNSDGQVNISAGVAPHVCLFNTFNMRTIKVSPSYSGWTKYNSPARNISYANQFGMAFGDPQNYLFTVMFGAFIQTQSGISNDDKFDFLISLLYTTSL